MMFVVGIENVNNNQMKSKISEKVDLGQLAMIDNALVSYFVSNGYNLPDNLDKDFLKKVGLVNIDLTKFEYEKSAVNKFLLRYKKPNEDFFISSAHSEVLLPLSGFNDDLNGSIDSEDDNVDVAVKDVFIGDDVVIHGGVIIGENNASSDHTFTHNYEIGTNANVNSDKVSIADNTSIGNNANIRNFVTIQGKNISIGDRVTLWSEAKIGNNVSILSAPKGDMVFQTVVPSNTTIKRTGTGAGITTFYSGSGITGGVNEIYKESNGNIDIYTKLPANTLIKSTGNGDGSNVYEISSSILGSHEIYNESNGDVIFSGNIQDGTKLNRLGKGIGSLFLNETSDISGECNISNDNDGNIFVDGELKSDTIVYTGGSKKDIYINSYANFLGKATFNNSSNYRIFFDGTMSDNATLNSLGKSSNKIEIGKGCTVEGSSTIRNDSDGGFFIDKCFLMNGSVINYIANKSHLNLSCAGTGFIYVLPNTVFTFRDNTNSPNSYFSNWYGLELRSGEIILDGVGTNGFNLNGGFGGRLNLVNNGKHSLLLNMKKFDWNGETIRYNIHNVEKHFEKHLTVYTNKVGSFLDVESIVSVALLASCSYDNGIIRITGNQDYGNINFGGKIGGNINIDYNGSSGVNLTFYNDLINGLENFTYNASNFGSCYFQKGVCLGKNITINNYSNRDLIIEDTTSIGDNSIITLSKDTVSDVRLRKIIPANSVVNL